MEERTSTYRLVTDAQDLTGVAETLENAEVIGADIETTGLSPRDGRIRLLQLATDKETFVVDVFEVHNLSPLKSVLESGPVKALHNGKFDHSFLWNEHGISLSPIFDTMLAAQLLDGGEYSPSYALEAVAERYLDETVDKAARAENWSGELSGRQLEYAARDAAILLPLRERLAEKLEEEKLGVVSKVEFGAVPAIAEMELAGIKLDVARWKELEKIVRERRDKAAERLEAHFPPPDGVLPLEGLAPRLNLNSPQQITDAFRQIGIELPDTRVWTLLKIDHQAARDLLEYRELQKKLGTYLETYASFIHPKTGRIHANFLQCRVPTGRLACVARGTLVEIARDQSKDFAGVPIENIRAGDLAYTYDENRRLTLRRVLWAGKTGHKEVLSIKWRSGSHKREGTLEATPDHEIRLSSGEYVRAENLKPGDRVLALGRDMSGWGYSRIHATGYPGPMRAHRFVFEAINGYLPEHVHHVDENKLNNLPENLLGMTNSEHVRHHVNGRMDEVERSRLAEIARNGWARNRSERLRSLKRGEESGRWLGLDKEWMEEVLWENAGKPTAFRDVHGIDYATAQKYLKMHGIDWKAIAENFTRRGELIDRTFYEETRQRMQELGFDAGLKASGISSRRWKKIKARFESVGVAPNNHEIVAVERTGRFVDVYDLEVEDTHNFIAGEICAHNCTNPNIQQIPHEDEFRRCFVAEEGNVLVIADYSQIELRILAEVSDDPGFVEAFQKGEDLHRVTAATMFGVEKGSVTKEQRTAAKRINFGLAYGRGPKSLSAQLGTDEDRARELIDEFFANYPKVQKYLQETANEAMRKRTLRTLSGRIRKFGDTSGLSSMERSALRREAMNFPVQGTAADIAKLALGYIRRELRDLDARLINCIHDEFVVECAQEVAPEVSGRMEGAMFRAGAKLLKKVPVEVEVAVSREWTK
jgi:DNA polymerase I-like protein with 3'-5' exonuclease and polymerase domains